MRRQIVILLAIGLSAVAGAAAASHFLRRTIEPPSAAAPPVAGSERVAPAPIAAAPAVPTASTTASTTAPTTAPTSAPPDSETVVEAPEDAGAAATDVRLGGWVRGGPLPICGRTADVRLTTAPEGAPASTTVPSCEAAYSEFPSGRAIAIKSRRGGWIELEGGWARIDEIRTAETVVVDGREYWHDLFNSRVARIGATRIVLEGDTDPCAGTVCGSAHGLWEQEQAIRERYAAAHPGETLPAAAARKMEAEIEAMNDAEDRSMKEAQKAALHRSLDERILHVPKPPASRRKHEVEIVAGGYLCCT